MKQFKQFIDGKFVNSTSSKIKEVINPCTEEVLSTIPAGLIGLIFGNLIELHLRTLSVIAVATIIFGLALGFADYTSVKTKKINEFTWNVGCVPRTHRRRHDRLPARSRSGEGRGIMPYRIVMKQNAFALVIHCSLQRKTFYPGRDSVYISSSVNSIEFLF